MLTELRIENFAIIDQLELLFKPGLVTFTGETGAGKSIIIDAVETLLGGRVDVSMIRSGAKNATIEATFQVTPAVRANVHSILKREELLDDPDYFILGREIRFEGRSVARINGRTVTVGLLRELGELVVDVHGQSEHLSLLRVREHLGLLDRYADAEDLLLAYSATYRQLMNVRKEIKELRLEESEAARRIDLLSYQINEIESARLQPGEEEDLLSERTRLANAESLASLAQQALTNLDEGTPEAPSAIDLLGQVMDALQDLARIDSSRSRLVEDIQGTFSSLTELARGLRGYIESIEFNPKRLDQVEERLVMIQNLKRKYGDSIPAILSFAANARQQMETIQGASERLAELATQEANLLAVLGERGKLLSQKRQQAAGQLNQEMEAELADLRMSGARFSIDFQQRPDPNGVPLTEGHRVAFDATGLERVEFLIAPNPGEGLKPLVRIASGGETSRLMLSLKNVLARADNVSTLIFDEIDQGIGGRVGSIVGHKLWRLARHHQVLCITHLPQLAAFGEQHLQVQKHLQDGRTITSVVDLSDENRLRELAQMLGEISSATMHSAREMLETAQALTDSKPT
ncbi:MAG: DNA repair protein RecN [Chloroflexi bacterium RBG_19FT_COMBO_55_16]|nr:MAG: DNA repair protein RecN [Chloroflexi bacterium RBG_19FT_COMBO_55_16]